jgi:hypothetical protein
VEASVFEDNENEQFPLTILLKLMMKKEGMNDAREKNGKEKNLHFLMNHFWSQNSQSSSRQNRRGQKKIFP